MSAAAEYLPRPGEFDPLAGEASTPETSESGNSMPTPPEASPKKERVRLVQFYTPSQLKAYEPPPNQNMLGDYHLQRGAPSVLAGPPGCGKSRAALWLGILGARGAGNWFGMEVRCQFRTLILQNENGLARLHRDVEQLPSLEGLDDWLRISAPPAVGLALNSADFRRELKAEIRDFAPNLFIVDPWNACVRDAMEKDFQEGFARLREVLADAPDSPACLILHHPRKPKSEDRHKGRNLQNLLSGSYVLISVARSVMVLQPASDDTEDARVVMTCAKNNDGQLGARCAWERRAGTFEPVRDFNFEEFDSGSTKREAKVREEHLRELFQDGRRWLALKLAAAELQSLAGVGRSAAYDALKVIGGRFSALLIRDAETDCLSIKETEPGKED